MLAGCWKESQKGQPDFKREPWLCRELFNLFEESKKKRKKREETKLVMKTFDLETLAVEHHALTVSSRFTHMRTDRQQQQRL